MAAPDPSITDVQRLGATTVTSVKPGAKVPDFTAAATGGRKIKLSQLKGSNVVFYFYPRDNTPGCATEGQDFRDRAEVLSEANTVIFGISRVSLKSFDLVSDPDEALCELFDVIKMKNMYATKVRGIERSTFLIDAGGVLRNEWRKVKVNGHTDEALAAAAKLL